MIGGIRFNSTLVSGIVRWMPLMKAFSWFQKSESATMDMPRGTLLHVSGGLCSSNSKKIISTWNQNNLIVSPCRAIITVKERIQQAQSSEQPVRAVKKRRARFTAALLFGLEAGHRVCRYHKVWPVCAASHECCILSWADGKIPMAIATSTSVLDDSQHDEIVQTRVLP